MKTIEKFAKKLSQTKLVAFKCIYLAALFTNPAMKAVTGEVMEAAFTQKVRNLYQRPTRRQKGMIATTNSMATGKKSCCTHFSTFFRRAP